MTRPPDPARRQLAERDLPGIGKAYSLETLDGARLLAVVHQSSRPGSLHHPARCGGADRERGAERRAGARVRRRARRRRSTSRQALEEMEAVVDGLVIDWVTLRDGSPGVGHTIAELEIRQRTRHDGRRRSCGRARAPMIAPEPHERARGRRPAHRDRPARGPARARRGWWADGSVAGRARRRAARRRRCSARHRAPHRAPDDPALRAGRHRVRARTPRGSRSSSSPTSSGCSPTFGLVHAAVPPRPRVLGAATCSPAAAGCWRVGRGVPRAQRRRRDRASGSRSAGGPRRRSSSPARSRSRRRRSSRSC